MILLGERITRYLQIIDSSGSARETRENLTKEDLYDDNELKLTIRKYMGELTRAQNHMDPIGYKECIDKCVDDYMSRMIVKIGKKPFDGVGWGGFDFDSYPFY